jgi:hypothetical protein
MAFDLTTLGAVEAPPADSTASAATPAPPAKPTAQIDLSGLGAQQIDLSSLGAKKDESAPPANANIEKIRALKYEPPSDNSGVTPVEKISDDDRGAMEGVLRFGKSLIHLPGNVLDAFKKPATLDEELAAEMISRQHNMPKPLALALHRIIIEPMLRQHELATEYEKLSEKHPEQNGDYDGPQHRANMHHIASVFPLVGPIAGDMVERYAQGDRSGAVSELLTNIAGGAALNKVAKIGAAKVTGKIAKNVETTANLSKAEEAATTARQTATQSTEDAAKAAAEAEAGKPAVDAHKAAEDALKVAKQTASKASATEQAAAGKAQGATKARVTANDELAAEQIADEHRQQVAKAAEADKTAKQTAARVGIANTARGSAENTLEAINKTRGEIEGVEPIDSKGAAAHVKSFGDAADLIQQHAKQLYQKMDEVSNGQFTNLREVMKANKEAIYQGDKNAPILQARLEKDMTALFEKHAAEVGPNDMKAASAAWRTSKVLEDLHTAVERSISGAPENIAERAGTPREVIGSQLGKRLNKLLETTPQADIENAVGKEGLDHLYKVAEMTSTPAKAAKVVDAAQNVSKYLKLEARASEAAKAEAAATAAVKDAATKSANAKAALAQAEKAEQAAAAAKQPTVAMANRARELRAKATVAKATADKAEEAAAALRPAKPNAIKTLISHATTKTVASAVGASAAHAVGFDARLGAAAGVAAEQGTRAVIQRMMVSPRVAKMLNDAVKGGVTPKMYGPLIAQAMQKEDEASEETTRKAGKK